MKTKKCKICENEFPFTNPNKLYCSPACRKRAFLDRKWVPMKERTCPVCKKKFTPEVTCQQRYCCVECRNIQKTHNAKLRAQKMRDKKRKKKFCIVCGKKLKSSLKKYCGRKCYLEHKAKHQRQIRGYDEQKTQSVFMKPPPPKIRTYIPPDEFFSQSIYDAEEAKRKKTNGRTCMREGCTEKCVGVYYFCEEHRKQNIARANAVDLRNDVACSGMPFFG